MKFTRIVEALFLCVIGCLLTIAQTSVNPIGPSEAKKIKKIADRYYESGDYNAALAEYEIIQKNYELDPEFNYKIGVCLLHESFDRKKGIGHLFVAANNGNKEAYKMIGWGAHLMSDFKDALKFYKLYIAKSDTHSATFKNSNIKKLIAETYTAMELEANPIDVVIENLGETINSSFPEYVPVITADDQNIYFTSRRATSTGGKKDHNKKFFEDIFHSEKDSLGRWKPAKHLHTNVNSEGHDAIAGMSADGQTLLIYRNDERTGAGDIYVSFLRGTDWTKPKILEGGINLPESWEPSASLTANEDALYFSSNRKGGYGGSDLYVAKRMPNGTWGNPVNLGGVINTPYDEDAPFIHPDGKTLYFSSKGHKNMGGFDIFKSVLSDSGKWMPPENLGFPINTTDDDIYFVMTANGKHGYYSSMGKDSKGEKDIYMVTFKEPEKKLAVLKGKVTDASLKPLAATIYVKKNESKKLNGLYNSNITTGNYLIILQPGNVLQVIYTADGYISDTLLVNTRELDSFNQIVKDVVLKKSVRNFDTDIQVESANFQKSPDTLVIKSKTEQARKLQAQVASTAEIATVLVDTLGRKDTLYKGSNSLKNTTPPKSNLSKNRNAVQVVSFAKDCTIDTSVQNFTISLNFGYKLEYLKAEQKQTLQQFYQGFRKRVVAIKVNTHTDSKGSEQYNMVLSEKRGISVKQLLVSNGFRESIIYTCFYGKSKPLFPNENPDGTDNPENRHKNRRVEIQFVVQE